MSTAGKAGRTAAAGGAGAAAAAAAALAVEEKGSRAGKGKAREEQERRTQAAETGPPAWAPRWAVNMHPGWQAAASVGLYFFHMVRVGAGARAGSGGFF